MCFKGLKKVVKNESLATHGMIFVGTKRLASYSKSGAGSDLDPTDVLLLINHFRATFHPYGTLNFGGREGGGTKAPLSLSLFLSSLFSLLSSLFSSLLLTLTAVREVHEQAVPVADYSALPASRYSFLLPYFIKPSIYCRDSLTLPEKESDGFVSASEELDATEYPIPSSYK